MKYINFKRYKFFRILKNINLKGYNFLKFGKYLNYKRYNFTSFYKYFDIKQYNFLRIYRYLNYKRYNFTSFYKYFDIKQYKLPKIYKQINYNIIKLISVYIIGLAAVSGFIYLSIPVFFDYDKSYISKTLCSDLKIKCEIKGKINYSLIPSPRLKVKNLIIYDLVKKNEILAKFETAEVKLPLRDLLNKKKLNFFKIELQKAQINLDYEKLKNYKNHFKGISSKDISLKKGNINFFDSKKLITTLENVNFKYNNKSKIDKFILEGKVVS